MKSVTPENQQFIDDEPTEQDLLGRRDMARNLASLIVNARAGSSFRLGIYGGWGEGKTSILRMMAAALKEHAIESAFVLPWMSPNSDQLTIDILEAIAAAVGARAQAGARKISATAGSSIAEGWSELAATDWKLKLIDKAIGAVIRRGSQAVEEWQSGKLLDTINTYLRNRKLVVFVDDVDRTEPALVPKLLLNLREALSLPNLYYVIALSPEIVQEGLRDAHPGYSDALRFLEKIVEYPFFLPSLGANDCVGFAQAIVRQDADVDSDLLASMDSLLPRNPRQLKLFARTLSLLGPQWRRFDRNEIALAAAYLVQLVALEFPRETRLLAAHDADIDWIEKFQVRQVSDRINASRGGATQAGPTLSTATGINDEGKKDRYIELCSAIGTRTQLTSTYSVRDMIALAHQPPILTWKEFGVLFEEAKVRGASEVLRAWVDADSGNSAVERQRVLFRRSVEYRGRLWGAVIDAQTQREIDQLLVDLDLAMDLLIAQIDQLRGFATGVLTADEWSRLHRHFAEASRFVKPADLYKVRRDRELQLIAHSLDHAPNALKGEIFLRLQHGSDVFDFIEPPPAAYRDIITRIRAACEEAVSEELLGRFMKPDGLEVLWQRNIAERAVAFNDAAVFHSRRFRNRLYRVLDQAGSDMTIQKNALTYLRILTYGAFNAEASFPNGRCRKLADDHVFVERLWDAATAKRLNFRTVGSLRKQREKLIGAGVPDKRLRRPKWWMAFEKEFRQLDAADGEST